MHQNGPIISEHKDTRLLTVLVLNIQPVEAAKPPANETQLKNKTHIKWEFHTGLKNAMGSCSHFLTFKAGYKRASTV